MRHSSSGMADLFRMKVQGAVCVVVNLAELQPFVPPLNSKAAKIDVFRAILCL